MPPVILLLHVLTFGLGVAIVAVTMLSAIRSIVLPRSAQDTLARIVFVSIRVLFQLRMQLARTYLQRDSIMALYTPVSLLVLLVSWLALVLAGYTAMFWAIGFGSWLEALHLSISSLLTLGFADGKGAVEMILIFSEAATGLILIALLIAYLPTMYAAFSRRETVVAMLEVRAGSPPSAEELFARYRRLNRLGSLTQLWESWEIWFSEIEETHTSLTPLVFFRSPQPDRSWVTAAGAVLDSASLAASALDLPRDPQQDLCIRAGYLALRRIGDFFNIRYDAHPKLGDPIHVTREEFEGVLDRLASQGVPVKTDRDLAWRDFWGWRVNYDSVLLNLAILTMAPVAPWSSDRVGDLPRRWYLG